MIYGKEKSGGREGERFIYQNLRRNFHGKIAKEVARMLNDTCKIWTKKKQCTNFTRWIEINSVRDYEIGGELYMG